MDHGKGSNLNNKKNRLYLLQKNINQFVLQHMKHISSFPKHVVL